MWNVESARCDICADENSEHLRTEGGESSIAKPLLNLRMKRSDLKIRHLSNMSGSFLELIVKQQSRDNTMQEPLLYAFDRVWYQPNVEMLLYFSARSSIASTTLFT